MKIIQLIFPLIFLTISCSNNKTEDELVNLKKENTLLKDSIKKLQTNGFVNSKMVIIPQKSILKLNSNNKIEGYFSEFKKLPTYNLYIVDKTSKKKKLIAERLTESYFEFDYNPKNELIDSLEIYAESSTDSKQLMFRARTVLISK